MATFNAATGGNTGGLSISKEGGFYRMWKTFNLPKLIASLNSGTAFPTSTVLNLFYVPASTLILSVNCIVHVAQGASLTMNVGITGDSATGFLSSVNLNSTSTNVITGHTSPYGTDYMLGKYVTTATTIDGVFTGTAASVAVFTCCALCVDMAQNDYKKVPLSYS